MKVILFDIDTLRADHMGCYGYGRDTTPVMDGIAKEGVGFDRPLPSLQSVDGDRALRNT